MTNRLITLTLIGTDPNAHRVLLRHAKRLSEMGCRVIVKQSDRIVWDSSRGFAQ